MISRAKNTIKVLPLIIEHGAPKKKTEYIQTDVNGKPADNSMDNWKNVYSFKKNKTLNCYYKCIHFFDLITIFFKKI